jgi:hypothetical protein
MTRELIGIMGGIFALVTAVIGVIRQIRRERRRAELLKNPEHHEWWSLGRPRH